MEFRILGEIRDQKTFASGSRVREFPRLVKRYGKGRRRKRKRVARIQLADGSARIAKLHWYEATGFGKVEIKIKRYLD